MFADILWPAFVLCGWEHARSDPGHTAFSPLALDSYPISHSLAMDILWGTLFGLAYLAAAKDRRGALVLGLGVVSHWILDAASHGPDMPLVPGGAARVGLRLWNSVPATIVVETAMFGGALWVYLRATRARDAIGRLGLGVFVVSCVAMYLGAAFGPPPPNLRVLAIGGLVFGLLIPIAVGWIDHQREPR